MLGPDNATKGGGPLVAKQDRGSQPIFSRHVFFVLWYRRFTIIAAISATLLAALVFLIFAPVRYTATTTMVLDTDQPPTAQNEIKAEPRVDDAAMESHVETIKSENVVVPVIKKLKLMEDPEFQELTFDPQRWFSNGAAYDAAGSEEKALRTAIDIFKKRLLVTRIPHSYVVDIDYTSLDPKKSALIANAIAEAYIEEQLQAKLDVNKRARLWLQQRIAELRAQATAAFESIQNFKSQTNLLVGSDGKSAMDVELQQLTESLAKARAETTLAQSRLANIEAVLSTQSSGDGLPDSSVGDALSSPVITKLQQQYFDDEKIAIAYASRYGSNHQSVLKLRSEMANLKLLIREEMKRIAETYKSDLKVAQAREQAIDTRLTEVFHNAGGNRQEQVKLRELESAANTYRLIYEDFLNRHTQAVQQQSFPSTEARVITFASPGTKTFPKIMLTLALATIGGASLGVAGTLAQEQMHRAIYARDQLTRELGVSCIAVLPAYRRSKKTQRLVSSSTTQRELSTSGVTKPKLLNQKNANLPTLLYNDEDPFSSNSEALRNIKVAIDLSNFSHETRTLGVVSALANEGKSSISVSLAIMLASAGRKVLLFDCDFRNPSLTNFLGSQNRAGILELLSGDVRLTDVTSHNNRYGFDFLSGPTKVRPVQIADILNSAPMSKLLAVMKEHYDYVIVDLPPILPVIDVRSCAHLFDSFALIAEWGKTSVEDIDRAFRVAPLVHERLLGIVLNKVDAATIQRIEGYRDANYGYYA
jgi:polysaccharide biosynthesis transport protein